MAFTLSVSTIGARDLASRFDRFPRVLRGRLNRTILEYAAKIVGEAARLVPVDTGYLKSTIAATLRDLAALIVAGAPYAGYVEYGTSRMQAQPYLLPAFEKHADAFYNAIKELVTQWP